jgi:hypothetical protein
MIVCLESYNVSEFIVSNAKAIAEETKFSRLLTAESSIKSERNIIRMKLDLEKGQYFSLVFY